VTGANGFVGKTLCKTLYEKGYSVTGTFRSIEQINEFKKKIKCVVIDEIGQNTCWNNVLAGINVVIHLASIVHKKQKTSLNFAKEYYKTNTKGTEVLAEASVRAGVRRLIYLSTIKVNGEHTIAKPFNEESSVSPQGSYAESKRDAEIALERFSGRNGFEIVILRPPLVYGPWVKSNFLHLLKIVDQGIPLPLASVKNRRSLIYLGNLIDAIMTCVKHPRAAGNTYFVSDGDDVSTPELIRRIGYALEKPVRLFPFPLFGLKMAGRFSGKMVEIDRLIGSLMADSSKIQRELDWHAPYSMCHGLKETAKWYKKMGRKQMS
jgi:nucleoside-diphosphate-sugar epimerase